MTESDSEQQRIAKLVDLARATSGPEMPLDDLWPAIRDWIERAKVVALPASAGVPPVRAMGARRSVVWVGAAVAAVAAIFLLGRASGRFSGEQVIEVTDGPTVTSVPDSAGTYEQQARILFNRLSLERSLLRPEALRLIDRDLHTVDAAIAELDAAVARDPNNPVLRRLLVSSYREKVDILKRVGNAE
jgi:hypothetical protein